MKTTFWAGLLFSVVLHLSAQTIDSTNQTVDSTPPQDTPYAVTQRDADSRIWERTTYEQAPDGTASPHVHRYTEMATGMHYKDPQTGEWLDSQEKIDSLLNGGAQAVQGQHQAYFPNDIYNGQISIVTPDGTVLNSRPLGLSYDDGTNAVLIAVLTNSIGYILGSNQVIYPNAFVGLNADLQYTYTKAGFEQDIIIREQPPTAAALNLNTGATKIQLLTEFFNPLQPTITTGTVPSSAGNLTDSALGFGGMNMERGKAFLLGTNSPSVRVCKQWVQISGRQFLAEEVPLSSIANGLKSLPAPVASTTLNRPIRTAAKNLILPTQHLAKTTPAIKPMQLAKAVLAGQGLVLDYNIVLDGSGNITFQGDTTYYVSGNAHVGNVTLEGGTVIKFATGASLITGGVVVCKTGPYRLACFTSKNDNSIGETISGSSGSPGMDISSGGSYLDLATDSIETLKYLRFSYAYHGLTADFANVWHSQFAQCYNAILINYDLALYNVLFGPCENDVPLTTITPVNNGTITAQNITEDGVGFADYFTPEGGSATLDLTNCIIAGEINAGTVNANDCFSQYDQGITGFSSLTSYEWNFYGVAGGGNYYLIDGHPARSGGTTNIDSTLLTDLKTKTTYPPTVYTSQSITSDSFSSQIPRDSESPGPDVGYHYDPLDYIFQSCKVKHDMTFSAGTVVGWQGQGLSFSNSSTIYFNGTVLNPCSFVRCNTAQELDSSGDGTGITRTNGTGLVNANFTHFSAAGILAAFLDASGTSLSVHGCEFWNGLLGGAVTGNSSFILTNNLLDRTKLSFPSGSSNASLTLQNCTFHAGNLTMSSNASWSISVHDSAFDGTAFSVSSFYVPGNYNAYFSGSLPHASTNNGDIFPVSGFNWQSGSLGNYYLPTNSSLINAGNTNANWVGLYHFTTQTNQVKETNSIVDIGYHYVALDTNGNPVDSDADGVPDYIEDANGNGVADAGESPWLLGIISQPQSQNVIQGATNISFSVVASGPTPYYYQWLFNGSAISGANGSTLTKAVVATNDEGNYSVAVTNVYGAVTSSIAVLTVNGFLGISGPSGQTVLQGANASFSVTLTGGNHPVYRWYTNGVAAGNGGRISGATSDTITISTVTSTDPTNYYVVVTNLAGSVTSSTAILTVISKPHISSGPTNTTVIQSDDVTLSALVTGVNLTFDWWLTNGLGTTDFGVNSSSYSKLVVQTNDAGHYSVVISNPAGSTNANADLTVLVPPWITQEPISVVTNQGNAVTFSISAFGTSRLFYQWYKSGTNAIANATNSSLTLNNVQTNDALGYSVLVTNSAGTNFSAWAWLSVIATGGGTNFGWGTGSTNSSITNYMLRPDNLYATNPAIYQYGPPISIRASAFNLYNSITNVAFYFAGTNHITNAAGNAVFGSNTTFAVAWTNALHGTNFLSARAWDSYGNTTDSLPVYVIMDAAPTNALVAPLTTIVWEGYTTNVWFTNYISDDGLPYAVTNLTWTIPPGVTTSNIYIYTSTNLTIATQATFTNSGTYPLILDAFDNFLHTSVTCTIRVEHRPVVTFNFPTNGAIFLTGFTNILDVTATDPDGHVMGVSFYDGATPIADGTQSISNTFRAAWTNSTLGDHIISAVATDNDSLTSTGSVRIAIVPPLDVRFQAPTNTQFIVFSPTNLVLSALPTNYAGFPITSVIFSNLTQSINLGTGTLTNGAYQTVWNDLTNGMYTIRVTARDSGGNVVSDEVSITVNAMPTVSIISPTNVESFTEISDVLLKAVASDTESGTNVSVSFYYTNSLIGNGTHAGGATNTFNWTGRSANYYEVVAVATDTNGASSASQTVVFHVKSTNTPPAVVITYPTNSAVFADGSDITITATTTNGSGTVTNVEFFVNRQSIGSDSDAPYLMTECCWKPGTYQLVAVATDDRGSSTISTNVQITILPEVPTGQGFWDPTFHSANSDGSNPSDQCGNIVDFGFTPASALYNSKLYFAGQDVVIGGSGDRDTGSLYQSDGTNWIRWGTTNNGVAQCPSDFPFQDIELGGVAVDQSGIYLAGFNEITNGYLVKRWDGTNWNDVGADTFTIKVFQPDNSADFRVLPYLAEPRLQFVGSDLYLFGDFTNNVNTNIQFIAKWNTNNSAWQPVGTPLNGPVYAVASLNGQLVVGGMFTAAGGNTNANHIAELINDQWQNLGSGVAGTNYYPGITNFPASVFSLAVCRSNLFVGGDFVTAGEQTNANGIAIWDGLVWKTLGKGLFSANHFVSIPGYPVHYVSVSDFINPVAYAISAHGDAVYVGGNFTDVLNSDGSDVPAASVARATWSEDDQEWRWSGMDGGIWYDSGFIHNVAGNVVTTEIMAGSTPGAYDVIVGGVWNGGYQGSRQTSPYYGISRWRVGYPQPPLPPSVSITNPPDGTVYTNVPSDIEIDAIADSSYTNIDQVEMFVDGVSIGASGGMGGDDYQVFWVSPTSGIHALTAEARDKDGLKTKSRPVFIYVTDTNNTVSPTNDTFTILVNDPPTTLDVLKNDRTSSGHPLHVVSVDAVLNFAFPTSIGIPKISADGTSIIYTPNANIYGTEQYLYGVTDGVSTNAAYVTIRVREKPLAVFQNPSDGEENVSSANIPINGVMLDYDTTLTNFSLYVNGALLATYAPTNITYTNAPANFFFPLHSDAISPQTSYAYFTNNWTTSQAGFYTFVAAISDTLGYSNVSSPVTVVITNSSTATNILKAEIGNLQVSTTTLGTFQYTTVASGLFDLHGTASDSNTGDAVLYQVLLHPPGDPYTTVANVTPQPRDVDGFHAGRVDNGDLGICDMTTVANGSYDMELVVRGGGAVTNTVSTFRLDSQLKIGQFSFSEQDLVLPVNGIPLAVTRTYNSLNPDSGPFGASWSFALNDMDVQLDDERTEVTFGNDNAPFDDEGDFEGDGLPNVVNMRTGGSWDVTLTLPDGRRTTFAFGYDPGLIYHAKWTAPAGVTAKLEAANEDDTEIDLEESGFAVPVWKGSDLSTGYAPFESQDFPGWTLTTTDGTKYQITRGAKHLVYCLDPNGSGNFISARVYAAPKLTEIDQVSTNRIVINDNGIFNYDPTNALTRWTLFDRDSSGRIKALHDPNGGSNGLPVVKYVYNNDNGNLLQVLKLVDRAAGTYTTNKYHYDNVNFPHYITSIERGDGVPVAQNFYDDSGRLTAVQDANGTLTQFNHSTTKNSEVVVDRLNNTNIYVYDAQGNVIWQTNALGQVTAMTYSDANNPTLTTAETNAYGTAQATWTLYAYDQNGNQTNVVSMGHTNSFAYDGSGNLLSQVDPLGNITQNLYDGAGNLTNSAQYDAANHLVTQSSSAYVNGKLTETVDANGHTTASFGYDQFGNLTNTTDANGFARSFVYDANGNQTGSSYQWTPPGGGSSTPVTTAAEYDASGRVIQAVDALGYTNSTVYNVIGKVDYTIDKFGNTNSFLYDALGNLIQTTYPNGTSTRTVYDAAGRAYLTTDRNGVTGTRTDYDAAGRATNTVRLTNVVVDITYSGLVAESTVSSAGMPISTNSTVYDAAGRVTSRTSPDGTTLYDYYSDGQLMHVVDALNKTNFYAYDAAGRQTNMVDALNHSTKFQYDAVGRMAATIYNDNTATTNIFNNLGQRTNVVDQANLATQFGYNVSGQLTNVVKPSVPDPENSGTLTPPKWGYLYDSYGHPTVTIDPKGHGTTNLFDQFSRQFSQRLPMNQTNLAQYNSLGQMTTNYDFIGQRAEFRYDQFGRLTNKFYFVTGAHPSNSVSYAYNQLDQVTNITERYGADADSIYAFVEPPHQPTSFFRKAVAYVVGTAPRWGGPTIAVALLCGLLTWVPAGRKLRYLLAEFCLRGGWRMNVATVCDRRTKRLRLPSIFWRAVTLVTIGILIVDDPSWDNFFKARADCSIPGNSSSPTTRITNYVYDFDGHLAQVNSPEGVINYSYYLATGRLASTCTTNSYEEYAYDELGRLKTVTVSKRNASTDDPITHLPLHEVTTYHYDNVGNRSEVDLPSGVVTTYLYDSLNRLTNLTHKISTTTNAVYNYVLDATGRRTNAVEVLLEEGSGGYLTNTFTWQFDGMYRLTNEVNLCSAAGASYTNSYSYDLEGNRLKQITRAGNLVTITNGYDANDQLFRGVTQTVAGYTETNNYAYDPNGSTVGKTNIAASVNTTTYAYDLMNKLASVARNGTVQASYQYNDQGIRVRGTSGGTTTYYLIDANNHTGYQQVLEEYSTLRGTPARSYVLGEDVLAQADSGSASYLLYDGHGNTRQVSDSTGTVASRYNYDAYGIAQSTSSSTAEYAADHITSHLYCGEQYDSTLQMYNLRARYYDPSNGRFSQRDTSANNNNDPQSLHKYSYANSDPINALDPSGQFTMPELTVSITTLAIVTAGVCSAISSGVNGPKVIPLKTRLLIGFLAGTASAAIALALAEIFPPLGAFWIGFAAGALQTIISKSLEFAFSKQLREEFDNDEIPAIIAEILLDGLVSGMTAGLLEEAAPVLKQVGRKAGENVQRTAFKLSYNTATKAFSVGLFQWGPNTTRAMVRELLVGLIGDDYYHIIFNLLHGSEDEDGNPVFPKVKDNNNQPSFDEPLSWAYA